MGQDQFLDAGLRSYLANLVRFCMAHPVDPIGMNEPSVPAKGGPGRFKLGREENLMDEDIRTSSKLHKSGAGTGITRENNRMVFCIDPIAEATRELIHSQR